MKTFRCLFPVFFASALIFCLVAQRAPGQNWIAQGAPLEGWISVSVSADGSRMIAASPGDGLYISTNSGVTWQATSAPTTNNWYGTACSADGTKMAAVSAYNSDTGVLGSVFTSTNSGVTWIEANVPAYDWRAATASADGSQFAVVSYGNEAIYISTDSGATWNESVSGGGFNWNAVASSADGSVLIEASEFDNFLEVSTDAGATWRRPVVTQVSYTSVAASADGTKLYAAGYKSGIYASTNTGVSWWLTGAPAEPYNSVTTSADGTKLAAAVYEGFIYTSIDSGTNWALSGAPYGAWWSVASSEDGNSLVAVDADGSIYTSTNAGGTWTYPAPVEFWNAAASSADGSQLAVCAGLNGLIYHSGDGGVTWKSCSVPGYNWTALASSSDGSVLAAAAKTGPIYISLNFGATWTETAVPGTNWQTLALSPDGTRLAAAAAGGLIYSSTNWGATWVQTGAPSANWQALVVSANSQQWVGAVAEGSIFVSADGGSTWTPSGAPVANWAAVAGSSDGSRLAAAVSGGLIYLSTNSGSTWSPSGAPRANWSGLAASSDGSRLMATANYAGVYVSVDSGVTWSLTEAPLVKPWSAVATSSDGTKWVAVPNPGQIYMADFAQLPPLIEPPALTLVSGAGQSAVFTVTITNTAALTYQWQLDGTNLTDGGSISGSRSPTLTVSNVVSANAGSYSVTASNTLGEVGGAPAVLNVIAPFAPWIVTQPATNVLITSANFNATFNAGGQGTIEFQWGPTTNYGQTAAVDGIVSSALNESLTLPVTNLSSGTTYHVRAVISNVAGTNYGADTTFTTYGAVDNLPFTVLFTCTNGDGGAYPNDLILGSNGTFFGTTTGGGDRNAGIIFSISLAGQLSNLWSFSDNSYASSPNGVTQGTDGNLYGTTSQGGTGPSGPGSVYRWTPTNTSTIYSFTGGAGGNEPEAGLIQGSDGNFYGTTAYGGSNGAGNIFVVSASGNYTNLFSMVYSNGAYPQTALLQASNGNFYGAAQQGGSNGFGAVFMLTPAGVFTDLHSFFGSDGKNPSTGLVQGADGSLYGGTAAGGPAANGGAGTIYKITRSNTFAVVCYLDGFHGANPTALLQGNDGNLYGTTSSGGWQYGGENAQFGTVFKLATNGVYGALYYFSGLADGAEPNSLVLGPDGNLYGTAKNGGQGGSTTAQEGMGTVFRVTISSGGPNIVSVQQNPTGPILESNSVALSAVATGAEPLTYQWLLDGQPLTGATSQTLAFAAAQTSNAGSYQVIVANSINSATSAVEVLVVTGVPVITGFSAPSVAAVGGAADFSVTAEGPGPLHYQWTFDGTNLLGATDTSFTIPSVKLTNSGSYEVVVTNHFGAVTSLVAMLDVGTPATALALSSSGWTANGVATISNGVLTLTDGKTYEAGSAFFKTPQYIDSFMASFTYMAGGDRAGNGITFVVQNSPQGASALGGTGGELGYYQISPSAALEFELDQNGMTVDTDGATLNTGGTDAGLTPPVKFQSGDPIDVVIYCALGDLQVTLTDTVNGGSFTNDFEVGDLAEQVGTAAYVGFTGGSGSETAIQQISNFSFESLSLQVPPYIFTEASGRMLPCGSEAVLTVSAGGPPPLSYHWYDGSVQLNDGGGVTGSTNATLTLSDAAVSSSGSYRVVISNSYGSITSQVAVLSVTEAAPPAITLNGGSSIYAAENVPFVDPGAIAVDACAGNLTVTTNGTVNIHVLGTNTLTYTAVGPSGKSTTVSRIVTVVSPQAPSFSSEPADQTAQCAGDFMLTVAVTGVPPPTYQWYSSGGAIANATNSTLDLPDLPLNGGGTYQVIVTNLGGSITSRVVTVTVIDTIPPVVTLNGSSSVTVTQHAAFFDLGATAYDACGGSLPVTTESAVNTNVLGVYPVAYIATDASGNSATNIRTVTVVSGPEPLITQQPPNRVSLPGGIVTFFVNATSSSPMGYQWFFDGAAVSAASNTSFILTNVNGGNSGSYSVVITNANGATTSSVVNLTVASPAPVGFNKGNGWWVNGVAEFVGSNALQVTDGGNDEAGSAFLVNQQYVGGFVATFNYQASGNRAADGAVFIIQESSSIYEALGQSGNDLGFTGISPSGGLELDLYPNSSGIAYGSNGLTAGSGGAAYASTAPVNITTGDLIGVTISYAPPLMQVALADTVTSATFTTNFNAPNLASNIGTNAYVGFSGGSGGETAIQQISNFEFYAIPPAASGPPPPAAPVLRSLGLTGATFVFDWNAVTGQVYQVQYSTDLRSGNWVNLQSAVTATNTTESASDSVAPQAHFYRVIVIP